MDKQIFRRITLLGTVFLFILFLYACSEKKKELEKHLNLRSYTVEFCEGAVEYAELPKGPWSLVTKGDVLKGGQCVRTSYDASAVLKGNFGDVISMMELTRIVLDPEYLKKYSASGNARGVKVLAGKAWLDIAKGFGDFIGETPNGLAKVGGTSFSLSFDEKRGKTRVVVTEGAVAVGKNKDPEKVVNIVPGQAIDVSPESDELKSEPAQKDELVNEVFLKTTKADTAIIDSQVTINQDTLSDKIGLKINDSPVAGVPEKQKTLTHEKPLKQDNVETPIVPDEVKTEGVSTDVKSKTPDSSKKPEKVDFSQVESELENEAEKMRQKRSSDESVVDQNVDPAFDELDQETD
ncbi:MAG: FecR domain-containing protein [Fibrobacteria bacterium]|nr:FecR domain-containing protein [Fibrobacteria bacterium]